VKRLALTGGIATGKSHVLTRFKEAGVPVVDADLLSRQVVAPGTPGLEGIVGRFGSAILTADGALDRRRLGAIVFSDPGARKDLESIVHPAVRRGVESFFATLPGDTPFAVADIPLLYETGREDDFDAVIVVACRPEQQIDRVIARDTLSRREAEQRVAAQLPIDEKVRRADYVIRTDGTYDETNAQVDRLVTDLRATRQGGAG
jgi:dephospho-CoA kinase